MRELIVQVVSNLIATAILAVGVAVAVKISPAALWQEYWHVVVGVAVGVAWLGGWWLRSRWRALGRRLNELAEGTGDLNVERVAHRVLAPTNARLVELEQKVTRLEGAAPKSQIRVCTYCGQKIDDAREEWGRVPGSQGDSHVGHARCIARAWGPTP